MEGISPEEYVFSPLRAEQLRQKVRRDGRKTPLYPSHLKLQAAKRKLTPKRPKRDGYDPASFRRAVKRLCAIAQVPDWTPNQLRHNAGTRFRKKYGIEVARILLGHRKLNTTEIYAEQDLNRARKAARAMG
jgi:integrase